MGPAGMPCGHPCLELEQLGVDRRRAVGGDEARPEQPDRIRGQTDRRVDLRSAALDELQPVGLPGETLEVSSQGLGRDVGGDEDVEADRAPVETRRTGVNIIRFGVSTVTTPR